MALHRLANSWLNLIFDDETGAWSLVEHVPGSQALNSLAPAARLVGQGKMAPARGGWQVLRVTGPEGGDFHSRAKTPMGIGDSGTPVGSGEEKTPMGIGDSGTPVSGRLDVERSQGQPGLVEHLSFCLLLDQPLLVWQLSLENRGSQPVQMDRLDLLHADLPPAGPTGYRFFANGWQSWSFAGAYASTQRMRRTRLGPLRTPLEGSQPLPRRAGRLRSEMFAVLGDLDRRRGWLAGFLSQREQFGYVEARLSKPPAELYLRAGCDDLRLGAGQALQSDWACLQPVDLDGPDPWAPYLEMAGRMNQVPGELADPEKTPSPTGWCSWYQFSSEDYTGAVQAGDIRRNLASVAALQPDLPLQVVQIDDGFERQVGDWLEFNPGFPEGVAGLASEIRSAGFTPGLWLAPFIVHPKARLAAEHPEWLLRGPSGRPANAGYLWGAFQLALDLTHPGALGYVSEVVRTAVQEWGFTYLKLDFLYAGGLPGRRYDPGQSRAQALCGGLQAIREAAGPGVTLLGCGCPLGAALGWMDAMRIGPDTARRWRPSFKGQEFFFEHEFDIPSARNACHNTLTRAPLHRRWWINDPDCLLLRPQTRLTLAELQSVASCIALSGGSLLLSDDLPALPEERLALAAALLPLIGRRPRLMDWLETHTPSRLRLDLPGPTGEWSLLALFNWDDRPRECTLRLADFALQPAVGQMGWAREFWSGQVWSWPADSLDGELPLFTVPPHGVWLAAVRFGQADRPHYVGSSLHISQGLEVAAWRVTPGRLHLRLGRPGRARGYVDLYLPGEYAAPVENPHLLTSQALGGQIFRLELDFGRQAELNFGRGRPD